MIEEYNPECERDYIALAGQRGIYLKNRFSEKIGRKQLTRNNILFLATELNKVMEKNHETPCYTDKITFTNDIKICLTSDYFKNREGITFWSNGEIGFAGWASVHNYGLVCDAFESWCSLVEAGMDKGTGD